MRTRALVVVAALMLAAGVAAAAAAAPSRVACTPGQTKVEGHPASAFCGPAKATVKVSGKSYAFKGGACLKSGKGLTVNIGTVVFGVAKQKPLYFGLNIGQYYGANPGTPPAAKDGTYGGGLIVVRTNGKGWDLNGGVNKDVRVTLTKNRTVGRFTGTTQFGQRVKVTGSFSC
jgi:hypothetical protein